MTSRIAVYGGSFDPFHLGHLVPVVRAQETFHFDAVFFVPSGLPPHKTGLSLTAATHRFAMVAMATLPYENFFAADDEVFAQSASFTIDTVQRFRTRFPDAILYFIMGSDSFSQITTWERWTELADMSHLVVLHRAHIWGQDLAEHTPPELADRLQLIKPFQSVADPDRQTVYLLDHEPFPISATSVRDRQRRGLPIRELVPHEVYSYIQKYELFSPPHGGHHGAD
jgi:nicotinate-nucleotide adenylyltransferase